MTTVYWSCECWQERGIGGTANVRKVAPQERLTILSPKCDDCGKVMFIHITGADPVYVHAKRGPMTAHERLDAIEEHAAALRDEVEG